jgi:hypothetical protein
MAALDAARAASLAGLPLGLFVRSLRAMLLRRSGGRPT